MTMHETNFHCIMKAQQFIHVIIWGQERFYFYNDNKKMHLNKQKSSRLFKNNSIWRVKYILKHTDLPDFNCQAADYWCESLYLKISQMSLTVKISMW